jgi:hypothetical protein
MENDRANVGAAEVNSTKGNCYARNELASRFIASFVWHCHKQRWRQQSHHRSGSGRRFAWVDLRHNHAIRLATVERQTVGPSSDHCGDSRTDPGEAMMHDFATVIVVSLVYSLVLIGEAVDDSRRSKGKFYL